MNVHLRVCAVTRVGKTNIMARVVWELFRQHPDAAIILTDPKDDLHEALKRWACAQAKERGLP